MGAPEVVAVAVAVLTIITGVIGFFLKGVIADVKATQTKAAVHDTEIAVLKSDATSAVHISQANYQRINVVENSLADLRGDVRVIRAWVDQQE